MRTVKACVHCAAPLSGASVKYCSNRCQNDQQYSAYVLLWKQGIVTGSRGSRAKNISKHLERYLREKFGDSCILCGWSKANTLTGRVPLEIDHIDGNADNNSEDNLRLICPNCHSLTSNYRNLNKGKGRQWRRSKYIKVT